VNGKIDTIRQRGNVLLSVMVISAVLMSIGATIYNHYIVGEAESVEKSLVDIRTYWAMMGSTNFVLGRTGGTGLCSQLITDTITNNAVRPCGVNDNGVSTANVPEFDRDGTSRAGSMQSFLDVGAGRLNDADDTLGERSVNRPGIKIWRYPTDDFTQSVVPYSFGIRTSINDIRQPDGNYNPIDGRLRIDLDARWVGTAPVLADLAARTGRLTVGICVVDEQIYPYTGATGELTAANCGGHSFPLSPPGNPPEGYNSIQFIQWDKSF